MAPPGPHSGDRSLERVPDPCPGIGCVGCDSPDHQSMDVVFRGSDRDRDRSFVPPSEDVTKTAVTVLRRLDGYVRHRVQQSGDRMTQLQRQALREQLYALQRQFEVRFTDLMEQIEDARLGVWFGMFGQEVLAEIELRELLDQVPVALAEMDRLLDAAIGRAVAQGTLQDLIARRKSDPSTTALLSQARATSSLVLIAIATTRAHAGRRSCARGDDPDSPDSANIARTIAGVLPWKGRPPCIQGDGLFVSVR